MPPSKTTTSHSPLIGDSGESEGPFCTVPQGFRLCKNGQHTNACRTREILSRNVLDWLRDDLATKQRVQIVRDFGDLTEMDMFVGFARWYAVRQMSLWQASDAETHMAISRGVPDLGSFVLALRIAEGIVVEEQFRKAMRQEGLKT